MYTIVHAYSHTCILMLVRVHTSNACKFAVMKRNDRIDKRGRSWSRGTWGMEKESRLAKE